MHGDADEVVAEGVAAAAAATADEDDGGGDGIAPVARAEEIGLMTQDGGKGDGSKEGVSQSSVPQAWVPVVL